MHRFCSSPRRVVVTGMGVVSPIGNSVNEFWSALLDGKTGVDKIKLIDASTFPSRIAAEVKFFDAERIIGKRKAKYLARPTQFAFAAFQEAKKLAGIESFDPLRTDVILGTATSEFGEFDKQIARSPTAGREYGSGHFDPQVLARIFINGPACAIALDEEIQGLVTTLSSACASALNAIGVAFNRIQDGRADIAVTGGTDCAVNYFSLNSFCASDSLSTNNEAPEQALCPFDNRHTKSVLAEGAAVFILEELHCALARGATILAEIIGYVQQNENTNELYMLDKSGAKWASVIEQCSTNVDKIDLICAHGPSDAVIDKVESVAIQQALGKSSHSIPVTSIKGAIGSPLGAAGGIQLATAILCLRNKIIPPTYNYLIPDPSCSLAVVKKPLKLPDIKHVLVNSHGFGGVNSSIVVRDVIQ